MKTPTKNTKTSARALKYAFDLQLMELAVPEDLDSLRGVIAKALNIGADQQMQCIRARTGELLFFVSIDGGDQFYRVRLSKSLKVIETVEMELEYFSKALERGRIIPVIRRDVLGYLLQNVLARCYQPSIMNIDAWQVVGGDVKDKQYILATDGEAIGFAERWEGQRQDALFWLEETHDPEQIKRLRLKSSAAIYKGKDQPITKESIYHAWARARCFPGLITRLKLDRYMGENILWYWDDSRNTYMYMPRYQNREYFIDLYREHKSQGKVARGRVFTYFREGEYITPELLQQVGAPPDVLRLFEFYRLRSVRRNGQLICEVIDLDGRTTLTETTTPLLIWADKYLEHFNELYEWARVAAVKGYA